MTEEKKEPTLSELIQRISEKIDSPDSLIVYVNIDDQVFKMYPVENNIHSLKDGGVLIQCRANNGTTNEATEFGRDPNVISKLKRVAKAMCRYVSKDNSQKTD